MQMHHLKFQNNIHNISILKLSNEARMLQIFNQNQDAALQKLQLLDNQTGSLKFKRSEISSLILLMALSSFESNRPNITHLLDFKYLLREKPNQASQKLKCFINYFEEITKLEENILNEEVEYIKVVNEISPNDFGKQIMQSENKLCQIEAREGAIESYPQNCDVFDFADPLLCGLTLDSTNVAQEEVIVSVFPEVLISALIMTSFTENSAARVKNILQFNHYSGYERTFTFKGTHTDMLKYRKNMVIIDARNYSWSAYLQFQDVEIYKEMKKIFLGCQGVDTLSTGKWGCGIFGGDLALKVMIQWAAYSFINPNGKIIFNAFNDLKYKNLVEEIQKAFQDKNVSELVKLTLQYAKK